VLRAEQYGYTLEDLVVLSGGHSIGFSASTNPQVLMLTLCLILLHIKATVYIVALHVGTGIHHGLS
jgi:hypothetical protein